MNATVQSILTGYPKIPDLPAIESIVSRTPLRWSVGRGNDHGGDLVETAAEILHVQSVVQKLFKPNTGDEVPRWQMLSILFGSLGKWFADIGWFIGALRMSFHDVHIRCALQSQPIPRPFEILDNSSSASVLCGILGCYREASVPSVLVFGKICLNDARKAT